MTWLIYFTMAMAEPFAIERLKFDYENQCLEYLTNPNNASTLAIEVIAIAGFNDEIVEVQCVPDYKIEKKEYNG